MRLWGDKEEPGVASDTPPQPDQPKANPLERAILGALAANPQLNEAIKGLLGMVNTYTQQQTVMLQKMDEMTAQQAEIIRLFRLMSMTQKGGTKVGLEGVIADGLKCPTCGATGACDCFTSPSALKDPGDGRGTPDEKE